MKKQVLLPALALIGGVCGAFLRAYERSVAFDSNSLHISGSISSILLIALCVVVVGLAAVLARGASSRNKISSYEAAFFYPKVRPLQLINSLAAALLVISGVLEIFGAPYYLVAGMQRKWPRLLFAVLVGLFAILAGFALLSLASRAAEGKGKSKYLGRLLLPAYMGCFWLLADYQYYAGNPTTIEYAYRLFAVIGALLAFYLIASFSFESGKPWLTTVVLTAAVMFCIIAQADSLALAARMRYGAVAVILSAQLFALHRNLDRPISQSAQPESGRTEDELNPKLEHILEEYREDNFDEK